MEDGDHLELCTSEFLDEDADIVKYQSMIGQLQWLLTLGKWDIHTAIMTLSAFRSEPRKGHLWWVKKVNTDVNKYQDLKLRYCTEESGL